jgi:hypothetical protein
VIRKWKPFAAALAALGVLAVGPSAASATPGPPAQAGGWPYGATAPSSAAGAAVAPVGTGPCAAVSTEGQGPTGENPTQICVGSGLVLVAPAVGQIASVIGPTIIGPAVIGTLVSSAGSSTVG